MRRHDPALTLFTLAALLTTACGGSSGAPAAPSPATPTAGATVSGTVRAGAAALAASTGGALQGVTVSVTGTGLRSGIDAAGRFALVGVPSGDLQLRFTGTGIDATLPVSRVQSTETIELVVNLAATFATVESERRSNAGDIQIEGRIESLPPTMPADSFRVAGVTVRTDGSTRIEKSDDTGRPFSDLEIGQRVHVVARAAGADYLAVSIRIQNTNTTIPVNVNGVIDDLTGNASAFEFTVGSRAVKGDTLTEFFGDGDSPDSFDDLADGVRVQVKGQQRDGFVYASRIHVAGAQDEEDDDDQDSSASIRGVLTSISGSNLSVGDTTVRVADSTIVQRRGDTQTLDVLQTGMTLHVVGDRQDDGSLDARRIFIMDDEVGDAMEIEGPAGGVQGACPALGFRVNGYSVTTNAATAFDGLTCGSLRSGTKVVVNGTRQADGSILATSVKPS